LNCPALAGFEVPTDINGRHSVIPALVNEYEIVPGAIGLRPLI
jgi:hypothetical protein